jgi:hypothetical protein
MLPHRLTIFPGSWNHASVSLEDMNRSTVEGSDSFLFREMIRDNRELLNQVRIHIPEIMERGFHNIGILLHGDAAFRDGAFVMGLKELHDLIQAASVSQTENRPYS